MLKQKIVYCKHEMFMNDLYFQFNYTPVQRLEALWSIPSVTGVLKSAVFTGFKLSEMFEAIRLTKYFIQCVRQNLKYSF